MFQLKILAVGGRKVTGVGGVRFPPLQGNRVILGASEASAIDRLFEWMEAS
jgi:hypothetical protein